MTRFATATPLLVLLAACSEGASGPAAPGAGEVIRDREVTAADYTVEDKVVVLDFGADW